MLVHLVLLAQRVLVYLVLTTGFRGYGMFTHQVISEREGEAGA